MPTRSPIPLRVIQSSRPLIYEHEDLPETPYYYSGSVFYVIWADYYFAVTARHVLRGKDLTTVRLLCHDTDRTFLGFDSTVTDEGEDSDYKDIAVMAILDRALCPQILDGIAALDLQNIIDGRRAYQDGERLVVSGYPGKLKEAQYEPERMIHQRLVATAEYTGPDPDRQHIHSLAWKDTCGITAMAGLSGSPVLCEGFTEGFGIAGVLIQGSTSTAPAHFVDSAVLVKMLRWQVADLRQRGVRGV